MVMAPLTRMRAAPGGIATSLMADYYGQRASAGLIITEGTAVSPQAHGYPASPGIYTAEQIAAWRAVTDRVHGMKGRIFMQLQHNGRGSLPAYNPTVVTGGALCDSRTSERSIPRPSCR